MLKIAIANDTEIAIAALRRTLATQPDYQLLWVARTGTEAVAQCAQQRPDLILMDMNMPELDGVGATRTIMQQSPCAILIVTASISANTDKVFEAMGHGALDVVKTPPLGSDPRAVAFLLAKIATQAKLLGSATQPAARPVSPVPPAVPNRSKLPRLVVIGASTGGPKALQHIFSQLPTDTDAAFIVVQHIDQQFAAGLVDWLNQSSTLPVALAKNGNRPTTGKILVAGSNDHLILRPNHTLRYTQHPVDYPHRPSVDVLFQSVAQHWRRPGQAIVLTGMGRDGAAGLAQLRSAGWQTLAESAESCVVFGMPKAAISQNAAAHVLPLSQIAAWLAPVRGGPQM